MGPITASWKSEHARIGWVHQVARHEIAVDEHRRLREIRRDDAL
jgi:hypothetical protein